MTDKEFNERQRVVAEARKFIRAPYVHMGKNYGGADCAGMILAAFVNAGIVEDFPLEYYPPDWAMHREQERYIANVSRFAKPVGEISKSLLEKLKTQHIVVPESLPMRNPLPADILVYQFGRCISHGALVIDHPIVIHASRLDNMTLLADDRKGMLSSRSFRGIWSVW